jgi:hypothetical protein
MGPAPRAVHVESAPPPTPAPSTPVDHPLSFRADFKLPFSLSTLATNGEEESTPFTIVPQLLLGAQVGRIGIGAGIGFTRLSQSTTVVSGMGVEGGNSASLAELMIAPTLTIDAFQSDDGKVRFYLLGAPIFGVILETNQSASSDLGFQFALGANYSLHENFRIGLEVGPVGHFYSGSGDASFSTISLYTALVGTFVYPR